MFAFIKSVTFPLILFYLCFVAALFFMQRSFTYFPDHSTPSPAMFGLEGQVELVSIETDDGLTLSGWYIAGADANKPVILFFHGNASHIGYRSFKVQPFIEAGYGVLLAEYRGYGGNSGKPTENGLYADARAYHSYLTQSLNIPSQDIVLYGESLGSGVATYLGAEHVFKGVILETPFTSLPAVAKQHYPFIPFMAALMHDHYPSVDRIAQVHAPTLFLIAGRDEVVSPADGIALYEAARAPKTRKIYEHATHNSLYTNTAAAQDVLEFLEGLD